MLRVAALFAALGLFAGIAVAVVSRGDEGKKVYGAPTTAEIPQFGSTAGNVGLTAKHQGPDCSANIAGVGVVDLDGDEDLDVVLPTYDGPLRIYRNTGRVGTGQFDDASRAFAAPRVPQATGVAAADYDNDGDQDLFIASQEGGVLLANENGKLADRTDAASLKATKNDKAMAGAWGDYDRDGRLDLYVAQGNNCMNPAPDFATDRLYHQRPDGTFERADSQLKGRGTRALGMAVAWVDIDQDRDLDLYVANDYIGKVRNVAWENRGAAGFRPAFAGTGIKVESMGIGIGELNGDGRPDMAVSAMGPPHLLLSQGENSFARRKKLPPSAGGRLPTTWGLHIEDFDNDGDEDVFSAAGKVESEGPQPQTFYLNRGEAGWAEVGQKTAFDYPQHGRGTAVADFDGDGLLDILVANIGDQPPSLYPGMGVKGARGHWLRVKLQGDPARRSPRDACGARATLKLAGKTFTQDVYCASEGYGGSSDTAVHFGLGKATGPAKLTVRWPGGSESSQTVSGVDRSVVVRQR